MSDAVGRGITVTEMAPMDEPIEVSPETTVAFVGRALRGPLNEPILVRSFGEYRRRFGDVWTRSSLGPAVRQFFDHGGRRLYVVRVANGARGAMLCLPASGSALVLRAREPGSTETLRAAVDYDGIDPGDDELFNLTLQRVDPSTGLVSDQEIIRAASYREDTEEFIGKRLLTSSLASVETPLPGHRPERTDATAASSDSAYVDQVQQGTDGQELSDYDLIGSRIEETGLFALQQVERLDLLYLPPPGKNRDLGPASLLAAELYCRERGAMLIADPAAAWETPAQAIAGIRDMGMASPNMLAYFPRMRLRHAAEDAPRVIGGALAGLLCKLDVDHGVWTSLAESPLGLNREFVSACEVDEDDRESLIRQGLNVLVHGAAGKARVEGSVTLGRGSEEHRRFASLHVRRLYLQIVNSIRDGTRWAVFERDDARLAERIRSQVTAYLAALANLGAFENDRLVVNCDAGVSRRADQSEHGVTVLVIFHPTGCSDPVSFTLHQTVAGCRVASTAFAPAIDDCA